MPSLPPKDHQKSIVNVPLVTFLPPVAMPLVGTAKKVKAPDTAVSVKDVMVTVPLPWTAFAAQEPAVVLFCVNNKSALLPACGPAPGMTKVPGALAVTARPRVQVGSVPPIVRIPALRVADTPLVADQGMPSTSMVIEPFNAEVEFPPELEPELDPVPDGPAGPLEPQDATLTSSSTAAAIRIGCLIEPPASMILRIFPRCHARKFRGVSGVQDPPPSR